MSTPTDWTSAEFVERRVLPLVLAFAAGVLVMGFASDARYADALHQAEQNEEQARQIAQRAVSAAEQAQRLTAEYQRVCAEATDMPLDSIPTIY